MEEKYAAMRDSHLQLLEEIESSPVIMKALEISLPNASEETDYEGWVAGARKFADDNFELLKDWIK